MNERFERFFAKFVYEIRGYFWYI